MIVLAWPIFHTEPSGKLRLARGGSRKTPAPVPQGGLLIPPQSAAIAAFSVALGRIAADVLAASGK
jgi:hypothetical protein